jgi:hypothetical protein
MSHTGYRVGWTVAAIVCAAYVFCFVRLAPLALQDYPNHLARALVVNDLMLHGGAKFGAAFSYSFLAIPYILNDWLLAALIEVAGIKSAAALWPVLVMLSLPVALLYYMRTYGVGRDQQIVGFLLSLYLVTNTFFFRGFLAFSLAVAFITAALGLARALREGDRVRRNILRYVIYCAVVAAAYLTHLTTLVFITAALAISAMWDTYRRRTLNWRNEFLIFLPIAALLGWHFLFHSAVPGIESTATVWGSALGKIRHVDWTFIRFYSQQDLALLGLGVLVCLWQAYGPGSRRAATPTVWEMLALSVTFTAIYLVLPSGLGTATWIDMRAVPMIALFLMLACLATAGPAQAQPRIPISAIAIALSALLALANLIYLVHHLQPLERRVADYRAVVARIPPGSWVFPVYTGTTDRPVKSTLHLDAYVLTDRQAFSPYQFSRDLGDPMQYFSYRNKPYAPDEDWYTDGQSEPVDWPAIESSYDYLLVMKPFDAKRVPISGQPVFENDAAVLMAVRAKSSVGAQRSAH